MDKIYNDDCVKIYIDIKDYFNKNAINVLNKETNSSIVDFVNLIYLNIN